MAESATKRRGRQPVEQNKHVFNMLRPQSAEATLEYGRAVADGQNPSPNKDIISVSELNKIAQAQIEARKAGKPIPSMPVVYQPLRVGFAMQTRARIALNGQPSKNTRKPRDWDGHGLGEWEKPAYIADPASDTARMPRRCHKHNVKDLVTDPDNNVVKIGRHEFVIGTDADSAIFMINGSKTGNYGANILAGKRKAFSETDGLGNIVGRINNNFFIENLDDGTKPGAELAWGPQMCIDQWGYLSRNDRKMSYAQIRNAVEEGNLEGITFTAIEQPIVGVSLTKAKFWQDVKKSMSLAATRDENEKNALERFEKRGMGRSRGKDVQANSWTNLKVQCRTNPKEMFPFGFFNSQTGIIPCAHFGDSITDERVTFVIGARVGAQWTENQHEARRRLNPAPAAETKTSKPRVRKPKVVTETVEAAPAKVAKTATSDADRKARKNERARAARAAKKAAGGSTKTEAAPATETTERELVNA